MMRKHIDITFLSFSASDKRLRVKLSLEDHHTEKQSYVVYSPKTQINILSNGTVWSELNFILCAFM